MGHCLTSDFYLRDDVLQISKELLGCTLFTYVGNEVCGGKIVEVEAYRGAEDRACHAYKNRRTPRTEVMFHEGGISYIYLCYGIHFMLNVVTNKEQIPHAILIRSIIPTVGVKTMLERRKKKKIEKTFTIGPGKVTQALGIDHKFNGLKFSSPHLWIEKGESPKKILATPRIGIEYAGADALLPWRFIFQ